MNVFYDPSKTDPATLLKLIKKYRCPNAQHTTDSQGHALNPVIAPGDPVQLQIQSTKPLEMTDQSKLPDGWKLVGQTSGGEGLQIVTLATPGNTREGNVDIKLEFSGGTSVETQIAVVGQVGSH